MHKQTRNIEVVFPHDAWLAVSCQTDLFSCCHDYSMSQLVIRVPTVFATLQPPEDHLKVDLERKSENVMSMLKKNKIKSEKKVDHLKKSIS